MAAAMPFDEADDDDFESNPPPVAQALLDLREDLDDVGLNLIGIGVTGPDQLVANFGITDLTWAYVDDRDHDRTRESEAKMARFEAAAAIQEVRDELHGDS